MSAWLRTSRDAKKPFSDLATTTVATTQRAVRNPPAFQRFGGEAKDLNQRPLGYEYIAPPHHPHYQQAVEFLELVRLFTMGKGSG